MPRKTKAPVAAQDIQTYGKIRCPSCNSLNWIYLGGKCDVEAVRCWHCKVTFWTSSDVRDEYVADHSDQEYDEDDAHLLGVDLIEEAWVEPGKETL